MARANIFGRHPHPSPRAHAPLDTVKLPMARFTVARGSLRISVAGCIPVRSQERNVRFRRHVVEHLNTYTISFIDIKCLSLNRHHLYLLSHIIFLAIYIDNHL